MLKLLYILIKLKILQINSQNTSIKVAISLGNRGVAVSISSESSRYNLIGPIEPQKY